MKKTLRPIQCQQEQLKTELTVSHQREAFYVGEGWLNLLVNVAYLNLSVNLLSFTDFSKKFTDLKLLKNLALKKL